MDFQKQLDGLEQRLSKARTSVTEAAAESHEQLKAHIAKVQDDAERELDDAKEHADEAVAHTRNGWEQMRADAKTRAAELKAEARTRREKHGADVAASDAELGEAEAAAAVDYAAWAIEAAELAILDALYLRARADEKAAEVAVSA